MTRLFYAAFLTLALIIAVQARAEDPALDQQARQQGIPVEQLRVFAEVMERIRSAYVEKVDDSVLLESAIRGMLNELDPHSAYLTPDQFQDLQASTSGEFGGLGIEVTMENGLIRVVTPLDNTPASKAGIESGDLILKINNTFVKGLSLSEAVDMMRGKPGTKITLQVLSETDEKPHTVTLERAKISIESVRHRMLEPGYGYLRISQFQNNTAADAEKALAKLRDQDLKGLILDLRNNPGGVLGAAVQVADMFLENGLIVYTEGRIEESRSNFSATPGDQLDGLPLVVLVNSGSASASEIVAGALQDQGRALVVGRRTFGKGSVQTVLPLQGNRALKLTTARYYTPDGRSIQAEGIEPDIQVEVASVELAGDTNRVREADLPGHLVNETSTGEAREKDQKQALASRDYALYQALSILKGIHLAAKRPMGNDQ